ncbi:HTH-type transcriptional regulator / antitoxin HipB [Luteibacter sp. 22Crub2.1]|nr:HTH-type transcriptional regulator / antitoxin HipB [Luteibacter sp. 22Crub2.1]
MAMSATLITSSQLGQLLHSSRKAKGLSQANLATRLGFSQSRVSHLEQHADQLSVGQLLAWCAALDLELTLGGKGGYGVREDRGAEW